MTQYLCDKCEYQKSEGQIQDHNGKIWNVCVRCAWVMYDEVDGDIEIVEGL